MKPKVPQPLLQTPDDQISKVEKYKLNSDFARGNLHDDFRDEASDSVADETEQIAKSHGIYLEYNRSKTGREKDWMYMVRVSVPGGGAFTRAHWQVFDDLSEKYGVNPEGRASLRVTTRQNVQFHWVKKPHVVEIVSEIAKTGFFTLNGCGDNTRNVMGCPLSTYSDVFNANALAHRLGEYFRLPADPHIQVFEIDTSYLNTPDKHYEYGPKLLNRKFKIAIAAAHRDRVTGKLKADNCVELRTNEVGIAPVIDDDGQGVNGFQVYIGGGQGEKNGKPTFAGLGLPFGYFANEDDLLKGLDAIVHTHEEWGDRKNRHWARMKYVVQAQGIEWFQQQARDRGAKFDQPIADFDIGPRCLHHGWQTQPTNGRLAYGAYIENGRLTNGPSGKLKSMVRHLMDHYDIELMTTPNQDLLFTNIDPDAKKDFEHDLTEFGYGKLDGKPYSTLRVLSGACVGLYTCRLAYTESEQFEPELLGQLEEMGYGDVHESIGITGCERQCFRPATKTLGWVGQGPDMYGLKIGGSEDARLQGFWVSDGEKWYLKQVPRDEVANVSAALFDHYLANRADDSESMGVFHRRLGRQAIIDHLLDNPRTKHLMEKTSDAPYDPGDGVR